MNCLTYLLYLWQEGHRFKIYYNGNHCIGVNTKKVFDLNNTFKQDFLGGGVHAYLPIEDCHAVGVVISAFGLNNKESKILKEIYDNKTL